MPKVTIDNLAIMIQNGFNEVYERMASKEDLKDLEDHLTDKFERRFELIEDKLRIIITALQRIEIIPQNI